MERLLQPIAYVKGIGPKKADLFSRLGVHTLEDVLHYYPRAYEDRRRFSCIKEAISGEAVCIRAIVSAPASTRMLRKGMTISKLRVFDPSGGLELVFFNSQYTAENLKQGQEYDFYGQVGGFGFARSMTNPVFEVAGRGFLTGCILPIYPLTAGLSHRDMMAAVHGALEALPMGYNDFLPDFLREGYGLPHISDALRAIHGPKDDKDLAFAKNRLIFSEFFLLSLGLSLIKNHRVLTRGLDYQNLDLSDFYALLPFSFTAAQERCVEDCLNDIKNGRLLNRLVQGDVGSGKTAIAAALACLTAKNGYQTALMAPTEILASQHFQSLSPLFAQMGFETVLLTGSLTAAKKRQVLEKIQNGAALVIGTHALLEEKVQFHRLGLMIADEQHRFGVAQRGTLAAKGSHPHILVMSATPIPRTLALILYGDLDVSLVNELPPGRLPIKTYAVGEDMRLRIYAFVEKLCKAGRQVYIVCPLVEDGEEASEDMKSVTAYAKELETQIFPHLSLGFLHGKLKAKEKEAMMARFSSGEVQVLIATTVIEVGVNVPNAALMLVENADRFGLSQLHQLRGRVGRGVHESFCVLFGKDKGEKAQQRLHILSKSSDGFVIAEEDLKIRGPGDFFGRRQHGMPQLKIADLSQDIEQLHRAQQAAMELLQRSPDLKDYPLLRSKVDHLFEDSCL